MEVFNKPIKQEDKATRVHFGLHFQHSLQIYGNLIYDFNQVGRNVTYQVPTKKRYCSLLLQECTRIQKF